MQFQILIRLASGHRRWDTYDTLSDMWNPSYAKPTTEEEALRFARRLIADRNARAPSYVCDEKVLDVEVL